MTKERRMIFHMAAVKYHISKDTNRPNRCYADKNPCPLGADTPHFPTKEAAKDYVAKEAAASHDTFTSMRKAKTSVKNSSTNSPEGKTSSMNSDSKYAALKEERDAKFREWNEARQVGDEAAAQFYFEEYQAKLQEVEAMVAARAKETAAAAAPMEFDLSRRPGTGSADEEELEDLSEVTPSDEVFISNKPSSSKDSSRLMAFAATPEAFTEEPFTSTYNPGLSTPADYDAETDTYSFEDSVNLNERRFVDYYMDKVSPQTPPASPEYKAARPIVHKILEEHGVLDSFHYTPIVGEDDFGNPEVKRYESTADEEGAVNALRGLFK